MKNTTFILCCLFCAALLQNLGAQSAANPNPPQRRLREVSFHGSGYALGLQHGKELKSAISELVAKWKKSVENELKKPAEDVVAAFFAYAHFDEAIKKWTPELYEEVRGIADGSGQPFNYIMVQNLLDEFWVWQDARDKHHCSGMGVPARDGNPSYIAQNMDLEAYPDGYQVLMRLAKTDNTPEQLILTYPGLIALNGLNEVGIGACMNTLMQLKANATGLPVAFVVRHILNSTDKDEILRFIQSVPHASGQNYIIGIKGEVYDFEASCNKVVRFDPKNTNGTVYHTNHPVANDDRKDWYKEQKAGNSTIRLSSVQGRMASLESIKDADIKAALRAKDDPGNPVCRTFNGWGGTFGSVVMTLTGNPKLQITAGPPDESEYKEVRFSRGKTLPGEEGWRTISGYMLSEINDPLIGGNIGQDEQYIGTVSDFNGRYTLHIPLSCKSLRFFYDGYTTSTIPLSTSDTINVVLAPVDLYIHSLNYKYRVARKQTTYVTGTIKHERGEAIRPRVRIEGTKTVVYADKDGNFSITVPPQYDILSFEADNCLAQKILLGDFRTLYVQMRIWTEVEVENNKKENELRRKIYKRRIKRLKREK